MRVLILADEVWNDDIYGNNVLTNWFDGFPADFAEIYASPGIPCNTICGKYFQLTDGEMLRSIISNRKAGKSFEGDYSKETNTKAYNSTDVGHLCFLRAHMGNLLRLMKTVVWNLGKVDEGKLKEFIEDFQPDIIFSARFAHSKILRIEKMAMKYAHCPIVAFTGDNEYSLRRFSLSPVFWVNLFYQRRCLRRMMPWYALYYTLSERQIEEYKRYFDLPMKILRKCSPKEMQKFVLRPVGHPIQIVYGGKLYAGRDKTLAALADSIRQVNGENLRLQLHIYTGSEVAEKYRSRLNDGKNAIVHAPVSSNELERIYLRSDIALSVESFDLALRLSTRVAFSTKLIDCLYSTCAVMMIGWNGNSGYEYLNKQNVAICIDSIDKILPKLQEIVQNPELLQEYKRNAHMCMVKNHNRKNIQDGLLQDFRKIIEAYPNKPVL